MENKPISLIIEDSKDAIMNAIKNTGLHISILNLIMKDISHEIEMAANAQCKSDLNTFHNNNTNDNKNNE